MPFFSRHSGSVNESPPEPAPAPAVEPAPKRNGLFGSRQRSPSPAATDNTHRGSVASRSTASSGYNTASTGSLQQPKDTGGRRGGLFSRARGNGDDEDIDPSIMQARLRVQSAEAAEKEADRALMAARGSVQQARDEVRRLELEVEEDARLAKIKQRHIREVSKRGSMLGRFG